MNQSKTKKKLCWNCDSELALSATLCPFCGTQMEAVVVPPPSVNEAHHDPLAPPYAQSATSMEKEASLSAPISDQEWKASMQLAKEKVKEEAGPSLREVVSQEIEQNKKLFKVLTFVLPGALLLFFSLALLCFSSNGRLTLSWDADLWPYSFIVAAVLLYLGFKSFKKPSA